MTLNEAFYFLILESGRKQAWIASKISSEYPNIKMSKSTLNNFLLGKRKITGEEFIVLCKILEVDMNKVADMVTE